MKARYPLIAAALLAGAHFTMRGLGLGAHTSVIAGMPQSDASWVLGPTYALVWMAFVTLTPILGIVAAMEWGFARRSKSNETGKGEGASKHGIPPSWFARR